VAQLKISWWAVLISFFIAFILEIISLPTKLELYRPEWVMLTLAYWLLRHPERLGVLTGAVIGFLLDALLGSYFGVHVLACAVFAFLVLTVQQRLKMFPIIQQSFVIFIAIGIHLMLLGALRAALGSSEYDHAYLLTALVTAVIWPVFILINDRLNFLLR